MTSPTPKLIRDLFSDNPLDFVNYGSTEPNEFRYSLSHPHSCEHCRQIIFRIDEFAKHLHEALDDEKNLVGSVDGSTVPLLTDFPSTIAAASKGCALYEWFLDAVTSELKPWLKIQAPCRDVSLSLLFEANSLISQGRWHLNCFALAIITDRDGKVHKLRCSSYLDGRVSDGDPCAGIIPFRPAAWDIFEPKSIAFAKTCLRTCLTKHLDCVPDRAYGSNAATGRRNQPEVDGQDSSDWQPAAVPALDLPTRLLEVGSVGETSAVRIVDLSKSSASIQSTVSLAGYAALSYCWGPGGNPVQLTSATVDTLQQGISPETLPPTIRHVVRLASSIGIRYLWIDALCILQDSDHDKHIELAKMAQYYHNSTVTICAASAAGASEGLERQGDNRPVHRHGPMQIRTEFAGQPGHLLLHSGGTLDLAEPTTSRGWTLQESLLSRRILICSNQLYFCCATANAEREGPYHALSAEPDRNFAYPPSLVPGIYPASVWRIYPLMTQWQSGVGEFSKRAISFPGDKLPAISGFARVMHAKFRAWEDEKASEFTGDPRIQRQYPVQYQGQVMHYLAGVFVSYDDQAVVGSNLLWQAATIATDTTDTTTNTNTTVRVAVYRAPTWSWACLDGMVVHSGGSADLEHTVVRLVGHECEAVALQDPYGAIQHAAIHVSGPMRLAVDAVAELSLAPPQWCAWQDDPSDRFAFFPDTLRDLVELRDAVGSGSRDIWLLLVAHKKLSRHHEGLVISTCHEGDASAAVHGVGSVGTFRRRGMFNLRVSQKGEEMGQLSQKVRAFFEVEPVTVRLV